MPLRRFLAPLLATCALAALLGCSADARLTDATLPVPAISATAPLSTCAAPSGTASVELSLFDTRVVLGAGGQTPVDRVEVAGTANGLADGERVVLLITAPEDTCPLVRTADAGATEDGPFAGSVNIAGLSDFRVVAAVTDGTRDSFACSGGCLDTLDGATLRAISTPLRVRLR